MVGQIQQPVGQKRLTNVAIVKMRTNGKQFEVAAYKNKVLNWREGIEKDINEVLQIISVFTDVGRGKVANDKDLQKVFGSCDQEEICRKILKSGNLQVSDREREAHLEGLFRDIVQMVVERCVHPQSGRQLTATTVDNALKAVGLKVQMEHSAKKQALKAIESLCAELPESFARAKMRLRMNCPEALRETVRRYLEDEASAQIEDETASAEGAIVSLTFVCGPSQYRCLDRFATVTHVGEGITMQVITSTVVGEGSVAAAAPSAELASAAAKLAEPAAPAAIVRPTGGYPASADGATATIAGSQKPEVSPGQPAQAKKVIKCSTCSVEFEDAAEYRQHCRFEWHNYNLKRKVKALPPVSAEEWVEISLDMKEGFRAVDA